MMSGMTEGMAARVHRSSMGYDGTGASIIYGV
jgi:hypothetical protein